MKKIFGLTIAFAASLVSFGQTSVVMNAGSNGTVYNNDCTYTLFDSGGTGAGGPYSNNESYVVTFCPNVPGDFITMQWIVFALDCTDNVPGPGSDADNITVYDGNSTAAPSLGTYTCGQIAAGDVFGATPANPSGCLTIEFNSNASNIQNPAPDFSAQLTCETPCDPGFANGAIIGGATPDSILVCVGDVVNFQDAGSTAGPSGLFNLTSWVWQWFDGSPDDVLGTPSNVSHTFNAPGQYTVQLTVWDDNGCSSMNATDIKVYVATYPTFDPFPMDSTICEGEQLVLTADPDAYEVLWSGFPVSVNDADNCMPDSVGIVQATPMLITGYDSNISLNNGNPDILSICVDIEHTFMGDFVLQVQCPTGQIMTLHQQGGGGTNLGIPVVGQIDCNNPATFGTPLTYCFTATAAQTWVQAVPGSGGNMPAGNYLPVDPLGFGALDGCPINGQWNLLFTDLWGGDDGSLPGWSMTFDPALDPPVTQFTPDIGNQSDSSYWDLTTPGIISSTPDGNTITVQPPAGVYDYTYTVINNFGCQHDSSVQITVTANPLLDVGLDTALCNGAVGIPIGPVGPLCNNDGGNYTYCYGNNENGTIWTFCPDNPGDGITFMGINFNSGMIEVFWDDLYIFDGNSTAAPLIAGPIDGNLTGMNWVATNPTGCITMQFFSDGSVACTSGMTPWDFDVSCGGGPAYTYSWTPNNGTLSDVTIPNPIASPLATTTYTLTAYPVGHPLCAVTDDITISIGGGMDAGTDSTAMLCLEGPAVDLFNWLGGTPQLAGTWTDPAGNPIVMPITPATAAQGLYEYTRDSAGCSASAFVDVQIYQTTATATILESDCQAQNGEVTINVTSGINPVTYNINGGVFQPGNVFSGLGHPTSGSQLYTFVVQDSLGCIYTFDTTVVDINVPTLDAIAVTNAQCFGVCDGQVILTGTNVANYSIDNGATFQALNNFTALCAGVYNVVVDNGFGCTDDSTFTVTEPLQLDMLTVSPDIVLCPGESFDATGTEANAIGTVVYTWEAGGTVLGTGNPLNLTSTGSMLVCGTVSDDCPSTETMCFNVTEPTPAVPMMSSSATNGCTPVTITFYNQTNVPLSQTTWTFSDGSSIVVNGSDSITHVFEGAGSYGVTMDVITAAGCVASITYPNYVDVYALPDANFNYAPIPATIYDTEVKFTNFSSSDVTTWQWVFGAGPNPGSSSSENPTVVYPEGVPGEYPMSLTVTNDNGCTDIMEAQVSIVNDVLIYAPSVFTPDGDALNQYWNIYISGIDIYDFHLVIYNRWGEPVWESYNSSAGWNGAYGAGGLVQDGTYVWRVEAKDSYNDKKYEFRGHVTVLK